MVVVCAVCLVIGHASPAYAYVDPGSGSMVIQLLFAGIAGVTVLLRTIWGRVADRFRSGNGRYS